MKFDLNQINLIAIKFFQGSNFPPGKFWFDSNQTYMSTTLFTLFALMTDNTPTSKRSEAQKLLKMAQKLQRARKKSHKSYASKNKNPGRQNRHIYTNKDMKM